MALQNAMREIEKAYEDFKDVENFAELVDTKDALDNKGIITISLYVQPEKDASNVVLPFEQAFDQPTSSQTGIGWKKQAKNLELINFVYFLSLSYPQGGK